MTNLNDMDLPDEVAEKTGTAAMEAVDLGALSKKNRHAFACAAIRAALQAMVDCGMARMADDFRWQWDHDSQASDRFEPLPVLIIRLDNADG